MPTAVGNLESAWYTYSSYIHTCFRTFQIAKPQHFKQGSIDIDNGSYVGTKK